MYKTIVDIEILNTYFLYHCSCTFFDVIHHWALWYFIWCIWYKVL